MSTVIDERVVEMRFDNKQFERETKTTMGTLAKLKEALKIPGAEKALQNVDKAAKQISMEGLVAGVETLAKRFSTLGIVGMRVVENITDALMNKLNAAVGFVTNSIVSGGIKRAMNIENAHFQLQALLKDEIKVQAVMDNAMESVDGTAYAYDEAAKAASMFAASGLQAGEEMLQALKGITGVAAMTNSDFESMSMIFTTVAGNGRLMGDQLLQLSSRGLNAASTIADYFREVQGLANITEGEIREMVSKGQISFNDFSNAMSWAFGDSAKRANETFTGAMSNMKSALARIGAEFVSPFVEQNGEMVQLFNALRIKINEVKAALTFNEQESALGGMTEKTKLMVQTVADLTKQGKISFSDFTTAILGTKRSEEQLADMNEKLAVTFDSIRESGYASNDSLTEITRNGVRAYDAIVKYMNGVSDGTIRATGELKRSVRELTEGTEVSIENVIDFANQGKITFDIFNNAIVNYSGLVNTNSKLTTESLKAMFQTVKDEGGVTTNMLEQFRQNGIAAASSLKDYINGVTEGTIRASYSTKKEIEEITGGIKITTTEVNKLAEEGKISFAIFQSAMEKSFGNSTKLTRRVTDSLLDTIKKLVKYVQNVDLTKPMEAFYNSIDSVVNIAKGMGSVIQPITSAFSQVFSGFSFDVIVKGTEAIEKMTSKFKLSEKGAENLQKAFKGVFEVADALIGVVVRLIKAINPSFEPIAELGEGALGLAGNLGEVLSRFAEWINTSSTVDKAINGTANLIKMASEKLKEFKEWVGKAFAEIRNSPITASVIDKISNGFKSLAQNVKKFMSAFGDGIKEIPKFFSELFGGGTTDEVGSLEEGFSNLQGVADALSFEKPISAFEKFRESISKLTDLLMSNKGINAFVTNMNTFFDNMIDAFKVETLSGKIDKITSTFDGFIGWIKENLKPIFEDVNIGGVVAAGSGIGMIYSIMKLAKSFESVANKIKTIPDMLGPIKNVLTAYQNDLKADQLLKIAEAIALLGITLTIMSFADFDQMMNAAIALAAVSAAILWALSKLMAAINRAKGIPDVLNTLAKGFKSAIKKFGRALEIKAVGSTIKDFAKAMVMVVGSIAAIFYMNKTDPQSLWKAVDLVAIIASVMLGIVLALVGLSLVMPPTAFTTWGPIAKMVLALAASLVLIVGAIRKIMDIDLSDGSKWEWKIAILIGTMAALAGLAMVMAKINSTGLGYLMSGGAILAIGGMIYLTVLSLEKMLNIDLPEDANWRIISLGIILAAVVGLMKILTTGTGLGNSALSGAGSLLGLAGVLLAITWSIEQLSQIPGNQLLRGVLALDGVMIALAVVFAHMNGIGSDKDTGKSVLYMAVVIGAITVALGVLSMIPFEMLAKSVAALGVVLMTLALDFAAISKIHNDKSTKAILAMIAATAVITIELMFLSAQPWEGLLAGAAGLSLVLLAMAGCFKIIADSGLHYDKNITDMFLALVLTSAVVATELYFLAVQPWEGLLAGAVALSGVLLAIAACFKIIGETHMRLSDDAMGAFIALCIASAVITAELMFLSQQPWEGLLAGATALSMVLLSMTACLAILSAVKTDVGVATKAALALDAFIAIIGGLLVAFAGLDILVREASGGKYSLEGLIDTGSGILTKIGLALGSFVGSIIGGLGSGLTAGLPKMGKDLGAFMENSKKFWNNLSRVNKDATEGLKNLAEMMIIITAAEIMDGLFAWATKGASLAQFGAELQAFGEPLAEFAEKTKDVDGSKVQGAANAAEILAKMSKTLPKVDGLAVKIFGKNKSLSDFGAELIKFGPNLKTFARNTEGIDGDSVQGAANAAQILSEMSKTLPKTDGFAQKVFGTNKSLSDFGAELIKFGPNLKTFARNVEGVTPDAVQGAADAASILSVMANEMPETDSLWDKLFGGGKTSIVDFSSDLIQFGKNMVDVSKKFAGFDGSKVDEVIAAFKNLVDLAKYIDEANTDADPITRFSYSMKEIALSGIADFATAFKDSDKQAKDAIKSFIQVAVNEVYASATDLRTNAQFLGEVLAEAVAKGIGDKESMVTTKINELAVGMLVTLETATVASLFDQITQKSLNGIVTGVAAKKGAITTAARDLGNLMAETLKSTMPQSRFKTMASDAFQGVYNGINAKRNPITTLIKNMGSEIVGVTKNALLGSFFQPIGVNAMTGFMTGLKSKNADILTWIGEFAKSIIAKMNTSLPRVSFVTMGANIASNLVTGINSQADVVRTAAQNLVNIANETMSGVASTIDAQSSAITQAAQNAANEANNALKNTSANTTAAATTVGKNTTRGVSIGIKNEIPTVTKATQSVAKKIQKTFTAEMAIHSPSQVMIDLAEYATIGVAEGIEKKIGTVKESVANIVEAIVSGFLNLTNNDVGEGIGTTIANGITGEQSEIESVIDRIVNSVTDKIEKLKDSISDTLLELQREYENVNPVITPTINTEWTDSDLFGASLDRTITLNNRVIPAQTNGFKPVISSDSSYQPISTDMSTIIKSGVGDLIKNEFSASIRTSISNAEGIQNQLKYTQNQNSLQDQRVITGLNDISKKLQDIGNKPPVTPLNTFYINGDNAEDIAYEVSRILQHQVEREESKWA